VWRKRYVNYSVRGISRFSTMVPDISFRDSHAIWTQHISGTFTQFDLREMTRPLDAIPRVSLSWEPAGSVAFIVDRKLQWEVPYDDTYVFLDYSMAL
jgi:hypothetical protein